MSLSRAQLKKLVDPLLKKMKRPCEACRGRRSEERRSSEERMGVKFNWGEVKSLDGELKIATIKLNFFDRLDTVSFDYCMICSGCNFGPFQSHDESLWFPHDSR